MVKKFVVVVAYFFCFHKIMFFIKYCTETIFFLCDTKPVFILAAPLYYVKRIPEAEIHILGTVESQRQERSSPVTYAPQLEKTTIESETAIAPERNSEGNVEESKRDVSLEELLNDDSKKREKRKNKDKKSIESENHIKTRFRSQKKSVHSTSTGKRFL